MKNTIFLTVALFISVTSLFSQSPIDSRVIFLHHSTGGGVWDGGVSDWFDNYNTTNGTSYNVNELAYPNSPYPWENYAYDYWHLWVEGACNSDQPNIECLNTLTANNELIIFKHCFPGAAIRPDSDGTSNPQIKTLENYRSQYRALRSMFDTYPDTKFMVWTLAPLHRLATNNEEAARSKEFVDWVNNVWLSEDGKAHPNIFIFDFFGLTAEQSSNPTNGKQYCLRYDYEGSHSDNDSHPNYLANSTIAPLFAQAIVNALKTSLNPKHKLSVCFGTGSGYYNEGEIVTIKTSYDTFLFNGWIGETGNVDDVQSSTTFVTMPDHDVTIKASYTEEISLSIKNGWNLISIPFHLQDSTIANIFNTHPVQIVKNFTSFWSKGQAAHLNSLKTLSPTLGYLIYATSDFAINLSGEPYLRPFTFTQTGNWQLIGSPFHESTSFTNFLNNTNCLIVKNFEGFWIPNNTMSSISNFNRGIGYFIK